MGFKMKGFSYPGNSPAKQKEALSIKNISKEKSDKISKKAKDWEKGSKKATKFFKKKAEVRNWLMDKFPTQEDVDWQIENRGYDMLYKEMTDERAGRKKAEQKQEYITKKSPNKQTYDVNDTDERVYDINQEKYDKWAKDRKGAPDIRYLGARKNNKWLEEYLDSKKTKKLKQSKDPEQESPTKQTRGERQRKQDSGTFRMKPMHAKDFLKRLTKIGFTTTKIADAVAKVSAGTGINTAGPAGMRAIVKILKESAQQKSPSPVKQEGPLTKSNLDLQPSEMEDTWIYKGSDLHERFIDYDERISFILEDIWNTQTGPADAGADESQASAQQTADLKKLRMERDILLKRIKNTKKSNIKPGYDEEGRRDESKDEEY